MEPFSYSDSLGHDQIRILTLRPGRTVDAIQCTLETVSLTDAADTYFAISYVWGSSSKDVEISCNGRSLHITSSLADALKRFRSEAGSVRLWADAICINQDSQEEKGHQVKRMGRVYEKARCVLVWLGHDRGGKAEQTFRLIRRANETLAGKLSVHGKLAKVPRFGSSIAAEIDVAEWSNLRELAALPWFRRLWVVQEAGLARECVLCWGSHELPFEQYVELALWFAFRSDVHDLTGGLQDNAVAVDAFTDIQCRYQNRRTWRHNEPLCDEMYHTVKKRPAHFVHILATGRQMKASDARDYIYAFLGSPLAWTDGKLIVEPDYTKSVPEVYFDAACALLRHPREVPYVLGCVSRRESSDISAGGDYPSWVARWDRPASEYLMSDATYWYCAGGETLPSIKLGPDKTLAIRGFVFDEVQRVSSPIFDRNLAMKSQYWDKDSPTPRVPFIDRLWGEVRKAARPSCKKELEDAFSLALARGYPSRPPETWSMAQHRADYTAYLHLVRGAADPKYLIPKPDANTSIDSLPHYGAPWEFLDHIEYAHNRRMAYTTGGRLGLTSSLAEPGDKCCIFWGLNTPFILRPNGRGQYHLVGDCYINGVMAGELLDKAIGSSQWPYGEEPILLV